MNDMRIILIADSNEENQSILRGIFDREFELVFTASALGTMEIARASSKLIDAILFGENLLSSDGCTLLEDIKAAPELGSIPVIAVIDGRDLSGLSRLLELGADDYITRPIDARIASARVRGAISLFKSERLIAQNQLFRHCRDDSVLYRTVLKNADTAVFEYNSSTGRLRCLSGINGMLCCSFGVDAMDALLKSTCDEISEFELKKYITAVCKGEPSGTNDKLQLRLMMDNGEIRWFSVEYVKNNSMGAQIILFVLKDIHDWKIKEKNLIYNAEYDRLTGVYNNVVFCTKAEELMSSHPDCRYMLLRLDINNFKFINDIFGSVEGDRLLKFVASKICAFVAEYGGICGRVSGDIFVMCLEFFDDCAEVFSAFCRNALEKYDLNFEIIVPFGIYTVDATDFTVEKMIDMATIAALTVKGNYLCRYAFYDSSMRDQLMLEQSIVSSMNNALEKEQFVIYFQPKCRLDNGEIFGAEALVRWIHPERGMIHPSIFVKIFERNGFIMKLDMYICERVCRYIRFRLDRGLDVLPVSINISRVNLYNPELCDELCRVTESYRIPVKYIELEITESAYADNSQLLLKVIEKLHKRGFKILMDDFGSGYSSLNMLKDIPVDVLKIDMQFLAGKGSSGKGGNILASIMRMARWLKLPVIVEGVETAEQARFLRSIGCNRAQGYLFYRPMTIAQYDDLPKSCELAGCMDDADIYESYDICKLWSRDDEIEFFLNSVIGGVGIYEISGGNIEIIRFNDQFLKIIGCDIDFMNAYGTNVLNSIFTEDHAVVRKTFGIARSTRGIAEAQYRRYVPDGVKWIHAKVRYLAGEVDRTLYFVLLNDITQLKSAEEQYITEARKYDEISDIIGSEIFDYDAVEDVMHFSTRENGKIKFNRDIVSALRNFTESTFGSSPDAEFVHACVKRAMTAPERGIVEFRRPNGRRHEWYRANYVSVADDNGKIVRVFGGIRNIQAQRMLEMNSKPLSYGISDNPDLNRFELMRTIINNIQGGVCVVEIDDDDLANMRLRYVNNAFRQLCCPDELRTLDRDIDISECYKVHPEDEPEIKRLILRSMSKWTTFDYACRCIRSDGSLRWYQLKAQRIHYNGNGKFFLFLITDITDIKRDEDQTMRVLNNVPCGIAIIEVSETAKVLFYNDALKKAHARMDSDIENGFVQNAFNTVHPDDRDSFRSDLFASLRDGENITCIYRSVFPSLKDGYMLSLMRARQIDIHDDHPVLLCAFSDLRDGSLTEGFSATRRDAELVGESGYPPIYNDFMRIFGMLGDNSENETSEINRIMRHVVGSIITGAAVFAFDGSRIRLVGANKGYYDLVNFKLGGDSIFSEEDHEAADCFKSSERAGFAFFMRRCAGTNGTLWLQMRVIPLYIGGENAVSLFFVTFVDISVFRENEKNLRFTNECYKQVLQSININVREYDHAKRTIRQSEKSEKIGDFGEVIENVPQSLIANGYIHPESVSGVIGIFERLQSGEKTADGIIRVKNASGDGFCYKHINYINIFNDDGKPYKAFGVSEDVTKSFEVERRYLRELQYKKALSSDVFATFLINVTTGNVEETENSIEGGCEIMEETSLESLFFSSSRRVVQKEAAEFLRSRSAEKIAQDYADGKHIQDMEFQIVFGDGATLWVSYSEHLLRDPKNSDLLAFVYLRDINTAKLSELKLIENAETDFTTGLLNKNAAIKRMDAYLSKAAGDTMQAMLMIDLDDFKNINDVHGHLYGDEVLKEFSEKLKGAFSDGIIGRFGGDEFFVLVCSTTLNELESRITEFYQCLNENSAVDVRINSTIGIACTKNGAQSCAELIESADKAMYKAKQMGKNRHYFYET